MKRGDWIVIVIALLLVIVGLFYFNKQADAKGKDDWPPKIEYTILTIINKSDERAWVSIENGRTFRQHYTLEAVRGTPEFPSERRLQIVRDTYDVVVKYGGEHYTSAGVYIASAPEGYCVTKDGDYQYIQDMSRPTRVVVRCDYKAPFESYNVDDENIFDIIRGWAFKYIY